VSKAGLGGPKAVPSDAFNPSCTVRCQMRREVTGLLPSLAMKFKRSLTVLLISRLTNG